MPGDLVIIGTGGHGREVLDVVEALADAGTAYRVLGFLDDAPERHASIVRGLRVLGPISWLESVSAAERPQAFIGIGNGALRRRVAGRLAAMGVTSPSLVHPRATVTRHARLEPGVLIAAGAVLTSSITVGAHSHVNVGASVSHDCSIGQFCIVQMGARLSGTVTLGDGVEIGVGAVVNQNLSIGEWSTIGSGAAVVEDLPANVTAVGVPARVIRTRDANWHLG